MLAGQTYRLIAFDGLIDPGDYQFTIGPAVTDTAGNLMDQDGDAVNGESDDFFATTLTITAAEQTVLLVNVDGSFDSRRVESVPDRGQRRRAGAVVEPGRERRKPRPCWGNTTSTRCGCSICPSARMRTPPTGRRSPTGSVRTRPARSSPTGGCSQVTRRGDGETKGRGCRENYYQNLKAGGGGLVLGTDHYVYHNCGMNQLNAKLGLKPFTGQFFLSRIPVDTANPLMATPNQLGPDLYDDSSPGQAPFGLQPNGLILYTVAWHSGTFTTPGISSTIPGTIGFDVDILQPGRQAGFVRRPAIVFEAQQQRGFEPFTFTWQSDRDGDLVPARCSRWATSR